MEQLKKAAPPGINLSSEIRLYLFGIAVSFMISLTCLIRIFDARSDYIVYSAVSGRMVNPDFEMPYFAELISGVFIGFLFVSLCCLLLPIYHYSYYSRDSSHALYLVRRLPTAGYLAKTCLILPLMMAAASLFASFVLLLLYYVIYLIATPEGYLPPDQWAKIMEFLI